MILNSIINNKLKHYKIKLNLFKNSINNKLTLYKLLLHCLIIMKNKIINNNNRYNN